MITSTDNVKFIKNYEELFQEGFEIFPSWLKELKTKHSSRLSRLGLPTTKDEEWKYTNITGLNNITFNLAQNDNSIKISKIQNIISENDINIVYLNGTFSSELSSIDKLPKGIIFSTFKDALLTNETEIKNFLLKFEEYDQNALTSLNCALSHHGAFLKIEKNVVAKQLIHVVHITSSKGKNSIVLPKTLILSEKSSEANIMETYFGYDQEDTYLSTSVTDIYLEENAVLHYSKAQDESKNAYHIGQTRVWQERNTNFDGFSFMTGGKITRNDLHIVVNGEGANANLNALYYTVENQHVDNHTLVDHRVPNCTSNQLYKGILKGSSRAVFNGKIYVKPEAQQTNSYQLNKNLLLGTKCRVDTKPQLEIFADDVKCTHGATIGQLDEEEIFYLQTRNISRSKAIEMISRGFAQDALDVLSHESVKEKLYILLEPSFAAA